MITRYYFHICNEMEKEIYTSILDGLIEYRETITLKVPETIKLKRVVDIFEMVLYDHPRIFYANACLRGNQYLRCGQDVLLKPEYIFPLSAVLELQSWLDERLEEICQPLKGVDDDFSKEIYIHNHLVTHVHYGKTEVAQPTNAYTAAGAIFENHCVCAGVSLAFKLLMDYLGIPCMCVLGNVYKENGEKGERHAWNIVYIQGDYYQIDVTWDLVYRWKARKINYDYFNITSKEMYQKRTTEYQYPDCTARKCNYFYYMNALVGTENEMKSFVSDRVRKGEKRIYFKYAPDMELTAARLLECLRGITFLGRYEYCLQEKLHSVFILTA